MPASLFLKSAAAFLPQFILVLGLALGTACSSPDEEFVSGATVVRGNNARAGYLQDGMYPDASALLPLPPAEGSPAHARDQQLSRQYLQQAGSVRWEQAAIDAVFPFPDPARPFSCTAGFPVTAQTVPVTNSILLRSMNDVGATVRPVKRKYQRPRPFMVNQQAICSPTAKKQLENNGAYPSGHAATGWAWSLILAQLVPDAADRLLQRGWEYGQSRAICNVHWQSDVDYGRTVAALVLKKLQDNAEFRADMEAARQEVAALLSRGVADRPDCAAEAAALGP